MSLLSTLGPVPVLHSCVKMRLQVLRWRVLITVREEI